MERNVRRSRDRCPNEHWVAVWLLLAPADQPWRLEGPIRHRLRAILCLQGCRWPRADEIARRTVARARSVVNGVPAPRGWDSNDLASWTETEGCPVCDRWFHPARGRVRQEYCSVRCRARAGYIRRRLGIAPKVNLRCGHCNDILIDPSPAQKFCSANCKTKAFELRQKAVAEERFCLECGAPIPYETNRRQKFCSLTCTFAANRRRSTERRAAARAIARAALICSRCGQRIIGAQRSDRTLCDACRPHANGHAPPPTDTIGMITTDPPPKMDWTTPEAENAVLRIALELELVRRECPEMAPRQAALQEARRRVGAGDGGGD